MYRRIIAWKPTGVRERAESALIHHPEQSGAFARQTGQDTLDEPSLWFCLLDELISDFATKFISQPSLSCLILSAEQTWGISHTTE